MESEDRWVAHLKIIKDSVMLNNSTFMCVDKYLNDLQEVKKNIKREKQMQKC